MHGSGRATAPEAAAAVVHAAARAAHLGARGLGGGQVRELRGVRVAAAVLPRYLAPRGGSGTCVDHRCRVSSTTRVPWYSDRYSVVVFWYSDTHTH